MPSPRFEAAQVALRRRIDTPVTSLVSLPELLELDGLDSLLRCYRERGAEGDDSAVVMRARADFFELSIQAAREVEKAPEAFVPASTQRDGRDFYIYGVIHGLIGGEGRDYKKFVSAPLARLDEVIIENGMGLIYKLKRSVTIPDFAVLGVLGAIYIGYEVGFRFPIYLKEMLVEALKLGGARGAEEGFLYDTRYYALSEEIRRGVEPSPPLPSRIELDIQMRMWREHGLLAPFYNPFAIVPRSLFMAGFALGHAETRGLNEVHILVGDLHTAEIQRALEGRHNDSAPFQAGLAFGRRQGLGRFLRFWAAKALHLGVASSTAMVFLWRPGSCCWCG
jgi:hypothetical protein